MLKESLCIRNENFLIQEVQVSTPMLMYDG